MQNLTVSTSLLLVTCLAACGDSNEMSVHSSRGPLAALQHSVGQGQNATGERIDVLDGDMYVRVTTANAACSAVFERIDTAIDAALESVELQNVMICYDGSGLPAIWKAMQDNACFYAPSEESPLCAELAANLAAAQAQCTAQQDAYAQLPQWEQAACGIREAVEQSCYANAPY